MPYSLVRDRDGAGDSGNMSMALWIEYSPEGDPVRKHEHNARPRVGVAMRVGSIYARSFVAQDWWQTTPITKILEDTPEMVRFETGNSTYVWKEF